MPSSATITTFYSFTANTRARSSQVNANFSLFRGHLVPINPSAQNAVNNTYDLGSTEYYWRSVYVGGGGLNLLGNTTTQHQILGFTNSSALQIKNAVSTGSVEILFGGVTTATFNNSTFKFKTSLGVSTIVDANGIGEAQVSIRSHKTVTTTTNGSDAGEGGFSQSGSFTLSGGYTSTVTAISGSTVACTCYGRPLYMSLHTLENTTAAGRVSLQMSQPGTGGTVKIYVCKNTTTSVVLAWNLDGSKNTTTGQTNIGLPASSFHGIYTGGSGSNNYFIAYSGGDANSLLNISDTRFSIFEL